MLGVLLWILVSVSSALADDHGIDASAAPRERTVNPTPSAEITPSPSPAAPKDDLKQETRDAIQALLKALGTETGTGGKDAEVKKALEQITSALKNPTLTEELKDELKLALSNINGVLKSNRLPDLADELNAGLKGIRSALKEWKDDFKTKDIRNELIAALDPSASAAGPDRLKASSGAAPSADGKSSTGGGTRLAEDKGGRTEEPKGKTASPGLPSPDGGSSPSAPKAETPAKPPTIPDSPFDSRKTAPTHADRDTNGEGKTRAPASLPSIAEERPAITASVPKQELTSPFDLSHRQSNAPKESPKGEALAKPAPAPSPSPSVSVSVPKVVSPPAVEPPVPAAPVVNNPPPAPPTVVTAPPAPPAPPTVLPSINNSVSSSAPANSNPTTPEPPASTRRPTLTSGPSESPVERPEEKKVMRDSPPPLLRIDTPKETAASKREEPVAPVAERTPKITAPVIENTAPKEDTVIAGIAAKYRDSNRYLEEEGTRARTEPVYNLTEGVAPPPPKAKSEVIPPVPLSQPQDLNMMGKLLSASSKNEEITPTPSPVISALPPIPTSPAASKNPMRDFRRQLATKPSSEISERVKSSTL